jgi:hypothetical protein
MGRLALCKIWFLLLDIWTAATSPSGCVYHKLHRTYAAALPGARTYTSTNQLGGVSTSDRGVVNTWRYSVTELVQAVAQRFCGLIVDKSRSQSHHRLRLSVMAPDHTFGAWSALLLSARWHAEMHICQPLKCLMDNTMLHRQVVAWQPATGNPLGTALQGFAWVTPAAGDHHQHASRCTPSRPSSSSPTTSSMWWQLEVVHVSSSSSLWMCTAYERSQGAYHLSGIHGWALALCGCCSSSV